jgi:hypothetical protein
MKPTTHKALSVLKGELEFLDNGGYRKPIGQRQPLFCMETAASWRQPLFFEDSPSCPKPRYCACDPSGECVLLDFVPVERRHETAPCWHIPLNEKAQTIGSLYRNTPNKEIEAALRAWLVKSIRDLEERAASESASAKTA